MDENFVALYLDTKINDHDALASLVGGYKLGFTKIQELDHIKLSFTENHLPWTNSITIENTSTGNAHIIYCYRVKSIISVRNYRIGTDYARESRHFIESDSMPTYREILQKVQAKYAQ